MKSLTKSLLLSCTFLLMASCADDGLNKKTTHKFVVAITDSATSSAITIWKLNSALRADSASEVTYPSSYFNQPTSIHPRFYGLAYYQNNLYVAAHANLLRKIPVSLDGNNMLVPSAEWSSLGDPWGGTANIYYLNNNIVNGKLFAGQIDKGVSIFDLSNWTTAGITSFLNTKSSPALDGAKSALSLGGKIYYTGDNSQGILRMDDINGTNLTDYELDTSSKAESITTDGTYIYTNDDEAKGTIHKYLPEGSGNSLTMTDMNLSTWVDPNLGGRIRGITYDNGYLYASPGATGNDRKIYAINTINGNTTDLGITVPEGGSVYGVIIVNIEVENP